MSASVAKARARPTRCCMPPDSSWPNFVGPFRQADHGELLVDDPVDLGLAACRATRVRSRHSRAPCARAAARIAGTPWRCGWCAACAIRPRVQVATSIAPALVLDQHLAARHPVEAVDGAQDRRFAGARQAHQDADLALADGEIDAGGAKNGAGRGEDFVTRRALVDQRQRLGGVVAEDDVDVARIRPRCSSHASIAVRGSCRRGRGRWRGGRWRCPPRSPSGC